MSTDPFDRGLQQAVMDFDISCGPSPLERERFQEENPEPGNGSMYLHCECHGLTFDRVYASPVGAWAVRGASIYDPTYSWLSLITEHPDIHDVTEVAQV